MPTTIESMRRLVWGATVAALVGLFLWVAGISVAVVSFNQSNTVSYSVWNHAISELGFPFASRLTWVFNGTLATSGLLLLPTLFALSAYLRTRLATVALGFGVVTCLALSALGIYGLQQDFVRGPYLFLRFLKIHLAIADVFFLGWLMNVTLFILVFYRRWNDPAARPVMVAGILSWLLYPIFLVVAIYANPVSPALLKNLRDPAFRAILKAPSMIAILSPWLDCHRPRIWWPAALEWALAWSMWLWFGMALVFLWRKSRHPSP